MNNVQLGKLGEGVYWPHAVLWLEERRVTLITANTKTTLTQHVTQSFHVTVLLWKRRINRKTKRKHSQSYAERFLMVVSRYSSFIYIVTKYALSTLPLQGKVLGARNITATTQRWPCRP